MRIAIVSAVLSACLLCSIATPAAAQTVDRDDVVVADRDDGFDEWGLLGLLGLLGLMGRKRREDVVVRRDTTTNTPR